MYVHVFVCIWIESFGDVFVCLGRFNFMLCVDGCVMRDSWCVDESHWGFEALQKHFSSLNVPPTQATPKTLRSLPNICTPMSGIFIRYLIPTKLGVFTCNSGGYIIEDKLSTLSTLSTITFPHTTISFPQVINIFSTPFQHYTENMEKLIQNSNGTIRNIAEERKTCGTLYKAL